MIKTILKNKIKKEIKHESSKILLYTLAGVIGTLIYKRLLNNKKIDNSLNYKHNDLKNNLSNEEYIELKNKIDEFNSRRINDKNNCDASINEIKNIINKTSSSKKDLDIDIFKEDEFEDFQEEMDKTNKLHLKWSL